MKKTFLTIIITIIYFCITDLASAGPAVLSWNSTYGALDYNYKLVYPLKTIIYVSDTFEGSGTSTALQNHIGDTGASWAILDGSNSAYIDGQNSAVYSSDEDANYYNTYSIPVNDYSVIATIHMNKPASGANCYVSGRTNSGSFARYAAGHTQGLGWGLYYMDGQGNVSLLAPRYGQTTLSPNTTYILELRIVGTNISMYINNVLAASVTNSVLTTGFNAGLEITGSGAGSDSSYEVNDWKVTSPSVGGELVRTYTNLVYATASANQNLDLYLPSTGMGPFPCVVWVHGGGWYHGDKYLPAGAPQLGLLARGYAVASINYRFSSEAIFPAQIQDVKAALRFLRGHAAEYSLDKNRVAVWGFSAGGHLAALAGTSGGVAGLEDLTQGNSGESSSVQAVIDWSGNIDFLQLDAEAIADGCPDPGYNSPTSPASRLIGAPITARPDLVQAADPITYITADNPPFFIQHGSLDCDVAWQQSQLLQNALGSSSATLEILPDGHGGPSFDAAANISKIADFLDLHLITPLSPLLFPASQLHSPLKSRNFDGPLRCPPASSNGSASPTPPATGCWRWSPTD